MEVSEKLKSEVFEEWIGKYECFKKVRVDNVKHGVGLVARQQIREGEFVFFDRPIIAMSSGYSDKILGPYCHYCFELIGNLLDHAQFAGDSTSQEAEEVMMRYGLPTADTHRARSRIMDTEYHAKGLARCVPHCNLLYCSEQCVARSEHENGNELLRETNKESTSIVVPEGETQFWNWCKDGKVEKWQDYMNYVAGTTEHFVLAGKVYAQIIHQVLHQKISLERAMSEYAVFYSVPWTEMIDDDMQSADREAFLNGAMELLFNALLRDRIIGKPGLDAAQLRVFGIDFKPLFHVDFMDRLVGTFYHCNVDIEFDNPLNSIVKDIKHTGVQMHLEKCRRVMRKLEVDSCDAYFADFHGSGPRKGYKMH